MTQVKKRNRIEKGHNFPITYSDYSQLLEDYRALEEKLKIISKENFELNNLKNREKTTDEASNLAKIESLQIRNMQL